MTNRRSFLASCLAAAAAPAYVKAGILMPVRKIVVPEIYRHPYVSPFTPGNKLLWQTPDGSSITEMKVMGSFLSVTAGGKIYLVDLSQASFC